MAAADVQTSPAEPSPALPDYLVSPNAVFDDEGVQWRYGRAPDYSKTRKVWEEGKKSNHAAGTLPEMVENLVKNWEVEASFKTKLQDWRTIDHANYTFAINGGPPQSAEHMLKVGTYNAIIAPNEYYSPVNSDFASSHKTFKRMMPTFAWEVTEVYSGPPKVAFKWRHWGVMKNDYVGFNDKGEKIVAKAHGGPIEIYGVTVAQVDDAVRLQSVDTWFDPLDMFRQIAPKGIINKTVMNRKVDMETALDVDDLVQTNGDAKAAEADVAATKETDHPEAVAPGVPSNDGIKIAETHNKEGANFQDPEDLIPKHISNSSGQPADAFVPHQGADTEKAAADSNPAESAALQPVLEAAATQGASMEISHPESNFHDAPEHQPQHPSNDRTTKSESKEEPTDVPRSQYSSPVTGNVEDSIKLGQTGDFTDESREIRDAVDEHLESSADQVHPHAKDMEKAVQPEVGEAVAVPAESEETRLTHEEMSKIGAGECPFLMNRE
ncbi:hypothetical protein LTR78_006961 [Recurvomyces mirabilis]|uniref:Pathogen-related protein n=1 Tax=Recurvomyces mirabilis TaxID=574656 RepID=A0AAE0WJZ7_9PEZI|nr:hypothetical protein LTR78_006961 [Recurvomyces mirabilis]KAK5153345.1 hypothetical protein LTS14_007514 [Recurvomyces mirabilis]